jgi:RND family efflux transporter MFP subunit
MQARQNANSAPRKLWLVGLLCLGLNLADAAEPLSVTTQPLSELLTFPESSISANAIPLNDTRLSAEVSAAVQSIAVKVGDIVDAGAVLLELDPSLLELAMRQEQARLKSLQAKLDLATYQAERTTKLAKQNAVSDELQRQRQADVATLRADVESQEAAVAQARRQLSKCTVKSPFRAVVMARLAAEGELAAPGTPLIRLVDADRVELSANLQPADAASLERGTSFLFRTDGRQFEATLRSLSPAFDPITRSREARFVFSQATPLPGAAGTLSWRSDKPFVPADLVVRRAGQLGVFIANDGVARFHPLPGAQEGRPAPIELPTTTQLIVAGRFSVQDGSTISETATP